MVLVQWTSPLCVLSVYVVSSDNFCSLAVMASTKIQSEKLDISEIKGRLF